jgi:hypothetical protein
MVYSVYFVGQACIVICSSRSDIFLINSPLRRSTKLQLPSPNYHLPHSRDDGRSTGGDGVHRRSRGDDLEYYSQQRPQSEIISQISPPGPGGWLRVTVMHGVWIAIGARAGSRDGDAVLPSGLMMIYFFFSGFDSNKKVGNLLLCHLAFSWSCFVSIIDRLVRSSFYIAE